MNNPPLSRLDELVRLAGTDKASGYELIRLHTTSNWVLIVLAALFILPLTGFTLWGILRASIGFGLVGTIGFTVYEITLLRDLLKRNIQYGSKVK